ncbi:MAG: hypothetical protein KJO90_00450 [Eudoraea sp.]|nr:hypothetical protein [Eudoraea sp.]
MKVLTLIQRLLLGGFIWLLMSCGPVIVASRPASPPPPWFYPNRLEVVRYVYFPELTIYYDFHTSMYLYFEGGIWVRKNVLPPRYRQYNLRRSRYVRVRNYRDDRIEEYHNNRANRGRSNLERSRSRRNE